MAPTQKVENRCFSPKPLKYYSLPIIKKSYSINILKRCLSHLDFTVPVQKVNESSADQQLKIISD